MRLHVATEMTSACEVAGITMLHTDECCSLSATEEITTFLCRRARMYIHALPILSPLPLGMNRATFYVFDTFDTIIHDIDARASASPLHQHYVGRV